MQGPKRPVQPGFFTGCAWGQPGLEIHAPYSTVTDKLHIWEKYLHGDPDRDFMVELFKPGGGLSIVGHDVTVPPSRVANYSSARVL